MQITSGMALAFNVYPSAGLCCFVVADARRAHPVGWAELSSSTSRERKKETQPPTASERMLVKNKVKKMFRGAQGQAAGKGGERKRERRKKQKNLTTTIIIILVSMMTTRRKYPRSAHRSAIGEYEHMVLTDNAMRATMMTALVSSLSVSVSVCAEPVERDSARSHSSP